MKDPPPLFIVECIFQRRKKTKTALKQKSAANVWYAEHELHTPRVGETAPDFELGDVRGQSRIRLSEFAGVKPVALVFGSFT